jgi:hypothetical protein
MDSCQRDTNSLKSVLSVVCSQQSCGLRSRCFTGRAMLWLSVHRAFSSLSDCSETGLLGKDHDGKTCSAGAQHVNKAPLSVTGCCQAVETVVFKNELGVCTCE